MAPLTEPAFARLRSVDPVLAEAAGDAAFELETDLFAALAKGIVEKGASDAFPFAWASLAAQIGEVSPERVLEAGSALEAFGKKTANALLGAAKAVRSGKIGMERLAALPDDEAVGSLCSLRCVDVRLAVRVLIGVLRRPDVLRFDDEAVRSGLMRVHGPRSCTQEGFEAFRARHAPFGSAATLCLWESGERLRPVFPCGGEALDALKRRDKRLGRVIERLGPIRRGVEPDLFTALVDSVIAQQISGRAAQTISDRLHGLVGNFTPQGLVEAEPSQIQQCGLSQRKVGYIQGIAREVASGALDLEALRHAPDEELIRELSALNGIGVWTAEMLMIFSLCRPDVLSWGDLGIRRGMALLYGDRELTRERFERRRKRYSPYGSVVSLYLWSIAGMEEALAVKLPRG